MKRSLRNVLFRAASATLAAIVFLTLGTPLAARVHAQDHTALPAEHIDSAPIDSNLGDAHHDVQGESVLAEQGVTTTETPTPIAESGAATPIVPLSLPTGPAKSAVTPQAISLPTAEGSIEGMGESFSPVLSSGTATYSVPIAIAPGRAGVQPSLALGYSSSGGNSELGLGWSMAVPFISRQTDRGLPRY